MKVAGTPKAARYEQAKETRKLNKVIGNAPNMALTDMAKFHASQNWAALWEEFYLTLHESGRHKFPTVLRYARHIAKNDKQLQFLLYYLGPEGVDPPQGCNFVSPQNWQYKRDTGGWASKESTRQLQKQLATTMRGLDALRVVGNEVTLDHLLKIKHMSKAIDRSFNYGSFPEDLSFDKLMVRWHAYLDIVKQVAGIEERLTMLYAKTMGLNFDDAQSLAVMLQSSLMTAGADSVVQSRAEKVMTQLTEMTMLKAAKFKTPMPPGAETIIEASADDVTPDKDGKPN